jgi:CHAD domain-containing protein
MSYCLQPDEPVASGIRRIAREELAGALSQIRQVTDGKEVAAVHATRKHIKKIRALLRLVRQEIGEEIFEEEDQRARDVARAFSGSRDARVQLQLLEKLRRQAHQESAAFSKTSSALEKEMAAHTDRFGPRRREARTTLQEICDRLEGWPLDDLGMDDLCCALQRSYRRGRKGLRCAGTESTTENFHSLRKRVKEVWYQTRILRCLNPAVMRETADAAKTLGQELGDLHDLALFRNRLAAEEGCRDDERSVLLGLICTRETELEQIALDLGARFFAEKPLAFERRLLRYAREWPTRPA